MSLRIAYCDLEIGTSFSRLGGVKMPPMTKDRQLIGTYISGRQGPHDGVRSLGTLLKVGTLG